MSWRVWVAFRDGTPEKEYKVEEWAIGDPAPAGWVALVRKRSTTFIPFEVIQAVTVMEPEESG